MPQRALSISTGTMIRFFGIIVALAFIYVIHDILFALLFAVIVASAMEPAIIWFKRRGIPRILGVILIYLSIACGFFFLVYLILPPLFDELQALSSTYPKLRNDILSNVSKAELVPLVSFFTDNIEALLKAPADYLGDFSGTAFDLASSFFGGLVSFILIVVLSFYLATQEKGIEAFLRLVTPLKREEYIIDLWNRSQRKLGRWMQAQLLLGALIGICIFFGLTFLGVEHALLFAILAAVFEIIPVVGPILAAIPAVATAFFTSSFLGLLTLGLYIIAQQTESHVFVPVVMRKAVGLSPLIIVLALLIGVRLGGILGILLAVPLTTIIAEFVGDWDKKKRALLPE